MTGRVDWLVFGRDQGRPFGLRRSSLAEEELARWGARLAALAEPGAGVGAGSGAGGSVCRLVQGDKVVALHRSPTTGPDARFTACAYIGEGARFDPREVLLMAGVWQSVIPAPGGDEPIDAVRLPEIPPRLRDEGTEAARRPPHDALRRLTAEVLRDPGRGFSCRLPPGTSPTTLLWGLMDLLDDVVGDGTGRYWTFSTQEVDDTRPGLPRFVFLDEWRRGDVQPSHFRIDLTGSPPPGDDLCRRAADVLLDAYVDSSVRGVRRLLRRTGAVRGRLGEAGRIARLLAFAEVMGVPVAGAVPSVAEEGEPTLERRLPDAATRLPDVSTRLPAVDHSLDPGSGVPPAPRPREPYPFDRPVPGARHPYHQPSEQVPDERVPMRVEGAGVQQSEEALSGEALSGEASSGPVQGEPVPTRAEGPGAQPFERVRSEPVPVERAPVEVAGPGARASEAAPGERVSTGSDVQPSERASAEEEPSDDAGTAPVSPASVPRPTSSPEDLPATATPAPPPAEESSDAGRDPAAVASDSEAETARLEEAEAATAPITRPLDAVTRSALEAMSELAERLREARNAAEARVAVDDIVTAAEQGGKAGRAELRDLLAGNAFFRDALAAVLSEQEAERALRGLTASAFADDERAVLLQAVALASQSATPVVVREALLEAVVVHGGARVWLENYRPHAPVPAPTPPPAPVAAAPPPRRTLAVSLKEPARNSGRLGEYGLLVFIVLAILLIGSAVIFLAGTL